MGRLRAVTRAVICAGVAVSLPGIATETDQFTVPVGFRLADLGGAFSREAHAALVRAARLLNARILRDLERDPTGGRAQAWREPREVARAVRAQYPQAQLIIEGLESELYSTRFLRRHPGMLGAYKDHGSIFAGRSPIDPGWAFTWHISSTINVGGIEFGTDKVGHFFDKGAILADMFYERLARGLDAPAALGEVVAIGSTEGVLLGEGAVLGSWSSGVYSNADLACDYSGLMFYRNLSEAIVVDGEVWPPMLEEVDGFWRLAPFVRPDTDFLTRFMGREFNEALNPSVYRSGLREHVRRGLRGARGERFLDWHADENGAWRARAFFDQMALEHRTWHGQAYGHMGKDEDLVLISRCAYPADESSDPFAMIREGDLSALRAWLDARSGEDVRGRRGESLAHAATRDLEMLAEVLRAVPTLVGSRDNRGRTPLHWAARMGRSDAIALLVDHGARVDVADHEGRTALHDACAQGHGETAALLLSAGASVDEPDRLGVTGLMLAAREGHAGVIDVLMDHGADPGAIDDFGWSGVHHAADRGRIACIRVLHDHGADVGAEDVGGTRPVHLACRGGFVGTFDELVRMGVDVASPNAAGSTPMHEAAQSGDDLIVERLVRRGVPIDARNVAGRTARDIARRMGHARAENVLRLAELGRVELLDELREMP